MKKNLFKIGMAAIVAVALTTSVFAKAVTGGWIKVSDGCNKCKITTTEYKCGKCGTGMSTSFKWDDKQVYLVYTFTCKNTNCKHSCVYKTKP